MNSTVNPNRYIPSFMEKSLDYMEIGNCEVFFTVSPDAKGKFYAMGFTAKVKKHSFYFSFKTVERMNEYIFEFVEGCKKSEANKVARKSEQKKKNAEVSCSVGDLFHYSWGYDQTNCDFYQVTEVKGKKVTLRKIAGKVVQGSEGFMCCNLTPVKDAFLTQAFDLTIVKMMKAGYDGKASFSMSYGSLTPTTETTSHYSSWYA